MGRGKARKSLDLINHAITILQEIQPASVRAVCYRLFALGAITSMVKKETNRVSKQLTWAREQGHIPWSWVVDETREAETISSWADPTAYMRAVQRSYRKDRWTMQPHWVEVWSEKGTVRGTLAPVLHEFGVTFRVMHGYGSATAIHEAAEDSEDSDKTLTVLYSGDWDPSGLHMSDADLPRRLEAYGGDVEIVRVALTEADIADPALPAFSVETKKGDTRYRWFKDRYGDRCHELDALSPVVLRERVADEIRARLDLSQWHQADVAEQAEQASMLAFFKTWPLSKSKPATKYDGGRP